MGKRKLGNGKGSGTASVSNDENADGWLSTRNKKKVTLVVERVNKCYKYNINLDYLKMAFTPSKN